MGVDLERAFGGSIQTIVPEGFGQSDYTKAATISLFGVFTLAHDDFDKGLDVWPGAGSLPADALWRPIFTEPMMRGHVIADCRVLSIT